MLTRYSKQIPAGAGFSMIDVLISIVVLATALLALAALQGALTRNGADARARSQIASYAEGLIDQMRSGGYDNIVGSTITADCTASATLQNAEACGAQTAAGVSNLKTVVTTTQYYYDGSKYVATAPASYYSDYKQVKVATTWVDASGQARALGFDTIVSPVTVSTGNTLDSYTLSLSSSRTPVVRQYNPAATAGVIPIAIGTTGSDTAATNPQPEILGSSKNQSLGGVSYNVLTYTAPSTVNGNSNQVQITHLVDTRVIGCHCTYGSGVTNTSSVFAQPYRPTYWDGTQYVQPTATSWKYSNFGPDANYSLTQTNSSNGFKPTQDEFCDICCRDRNDTSGDAIKFNPWNSDYSHYGYSGSTLTLVATAPSTNGSSTWPTSTTSYVNTCRLVRVYGAYAVATDLQNYFFGFLATDTAANSGVPSTSTSSNTASSPIPASSAVTDYQTFVTTYLGENLPSSGGASNATITASSFPYDVPSDPTSMSGASLGNAASLWNSSGLNTPSNINITYSASTPDYRYLHARGFYIDHLEDDAVKAINKAITGCTATTLSDVENCVFPLIPFTTINVTQLADWSVNPGTVINVSDTAITGGNPDQPLRGVVNALSSATNNSVANAYGAMGYSNSGIIGFTSDSAITPTDASANLTASQQFTLTSGGSSGSGVPIYFNVALSGLSQMLTNATTSDPSVSWAGTSTQIGTAGSGNATAYQTGSSPNYSVVYVGSLCKQGNCTSPTAPNTFTPTNTVSSGAGWPLSVTVQKYNTQTLGSGGNSSGCAPVVETACTVNQVSAVSISPSSGTAQAVTGYTTAWLSSADTTGLNAGTVITLPNPSTPGFTSTNSTTPDVLTVTFTQDATNSYTCGSIADSRCATLGSCSSKTTGKGTTYTYTAGTCGN
jgi:Tfp pilus assembly protein PilV